MMWNWLCLNLWQNDTHKVHAYFDNRLVDDVKEENVWVGSLRYNYALNSTLQLGLAYTYLDVRNVDTDTWTHQQRVEFDFNQKFKISEAWTLTFRNRMEVRFIEDRSDSSSRFRHRIQLSRPVEIGPICSYYTNIEGFYILDTEKINEVRTVPIGLDFKMNEKTHLSLFYMIQSNRVGSTASWNHGHVLGTNLTYTF